MCGHAIFLIALAGVSLAQQTAQPVLEDARFEVVSIRPRAPLAPGETVMNTIRGGPGSDDPEHIRCRGVSLLRLIQRAYGIPYFQIQGPDWLFDRRGTPQFDILANVAAGATPAEFNMMMRNMLIQRFGMKLHHETKDLTVYVLTIAKSGFKLKERESRPGGLATAPIDGGFHTSPLFGPAPISELISMLRNRLNSIIIDRTGLTGNYEIDFKFANPTPQPDDPPLPSIATALEQDLGLKLEKTKAPYDVVVVDHIEKKPTEN